MRINISRINCYCFAIYLFISELTLPFKYYLNNAIIVWVLSGAVFVIALAINFVRFIDFRKYIFLSMFLLYFIVNYFLAADKGIVLDVLASFAKFVAIPMLLFLVIDDYEQLFSILKKLSLLCLVILLLFVNQVSQRGDSGFMNYMEYGNGLAKCFVFIAIPIICYQVSTARKTLYSIILALILLVIFLYGNRGAFLSLGIFLFFAYLLRDSVSTIKRIVVLLILSIISFALFSYLSEIIDFIYTFTTRFNISSYSIAKLKVAVDEGISSSVGERSEIIRLALDLIYSNYGLPGGVSYFSENTGMNYPHNLLLDLSLSFGIFAMVFVVMYAIWVLMFMPKNNDTFALSLIFVFSISILMFSQSFWFYTLFWVFPVYHLFKNKNKQISAIKVGGFGG